MVWAALRHQNIFHFFFRILLNDFLQCRLIIPESQRFPLFQIFRNKPHNMPFCGFHAAIQINGCNDGFKGIRQNRGTHSAASMFFALSQQQVIPQVDFLCKDVQRLFTNQRCPQFCQFALRQFRKLVE